VSATATRPDRLLSVAEAAAVLGVHQATIYRLIGDGSLEGVRIGAGQGGHNRLRIAQSVLDSAIRGWSTRGSH
jgi:excisionase family DNA binding protein